MILSSISYSDPKVIFQHVGLWYYRHPSHFFRPVYSQCRRVDPAFRRRYTEFALVAGSGVLYLVSQRSLGVSVKPQKTFIHRGDYPLLGDLKITLLVLPILVVGIIAPPRKSANSARSRSTSAFASAVRASHMAETKTNSL
jgi:hypothetical protein